jgi:hypothetical protein
VSLFAHDDVRRFALLPRLGEALFETGGCAMRNAFWTTRSSTRSREMCPNSRPLRASSASAS